MKLCFNFYFMDVAILVMACHSNRPTGKRDDAEIIPTIIITSWSYIFSSGRVRWRRFGGDNRRFWDGTPLRPLVACHARFLWQFNFKLACRLIPLYCSSCFSGLDIWRREPLLFTLWQQNELCKSAVCAASQPRLSSPCAARLYRVRLDLLIY